jgi:RNA polymerase sigma-70 factor (ECF subfamily)
MGYALALNSELARNRETVFAAQAGDQDAWHTLFADHYPQLDRFFRSRVATRELAEDLAAETFVEAWRSREHLRWRNRPFAAWLFGIARRRLASHYRSANANANAVTTTTDVTDLPIPMRDEYLSLELRDLLKNLKPEYRTAIELRYLVGLSGIEAAAVMDRTHGAFRVLLHRALQAARAEFNAELAT